MSLLPAFEIGILNAWILMIWLILLPILSRFIIKVIKMVTVQQRIMTMRLTSEDEKKYIQYFIWRYGEQQSKDFFLKKKANYI